MELSIKDTGKTIYSMAMVSKSGPMVQSMRVTTCREGNTVTAHTHGRMGRNTQAIGSRTKFMAVAPTNGLMGVSIRVSGLITTCTDMVSIPGKMDVAMKVSMRRIVNTDAASTCGLMVASTTAYGSMVASTVREPTGSSQIKSQERVSG